MPIKCVILLISSNTWISWVVFLLSRVKVMVETGTAISVSARYCRLFDVYGIACFFRRIEHKHVALPVESNLPMSTVYVRSSGPLMDTSAYKKTNLHAGWPAFFLFA